MIYNPTCCEKGRAKLINTFYFSEKKRKRYGLHMHIIRFNLDAVENS